MWCLCTRIHSVSHEGVLLFFQLMLMVGSDGSQLTHQDSNGCDFPQTQICLLSELSASYMQQSTFKAFFLRERRGFELVCWVIKTRLDRMFDNCFYLFMMVRYLKGQIYQNTTNKTRMIPVTVVNSVCFRSRGRLN